MPERTCSSTPKSPSISTATQDLSSSTPMPVSPPSSAKPKSKEWSSPPNCQLSTVNCQLKKPSSSRSSASSPQPFVRQAPTTALLASATTATNSPRRSTSSTTISPSSARPTRPSNSSVSPSPRQWQKSSASAWACSALRCPNACSLSLQKSHSCMKGELSQKRKNSLPLMFF